MKKFTLFLIAIFAMVNVANAQRAWAYDLELTPSGDSYTFAFKAVTAGDATLVFYKEGIEAGTLNLGSVSAGDNTVTKTSEELLAAIQQSGDFTWGVKMSAGAIAAGSTLTEVGSADFYNMMGVVVDNNPESSTFSQIYIQQAYEYTSGTTAERNKSQKAGIFIYDQQLNELNNPNNKGIVPNVPDAYKAYFGKNRDAMKRLAINPKTGQLAFCYNITLTGQAAAVWAMDLEELTPTAGSVTTVNLIDGITAFNKPNSLCFDEDGTLFVLADGGYSSTLGSLGTIYKIVDGTATVFSTFKYANGENAIASDGKGGLWVAQQRNNLDGFSAYTHHKADGEVDYTVTNKSSDEVKSLFQHTAEYMSKRGAIAYDVKRDILAVGGDKKVILFSVAYDATTGAPTLTKLFATPTIGGNIDGITFDYAGDVYVVSSSSEKFQKFAVPTNNNTCTVPAKKAQVITLVSATPEYTVTINVNGNGTVTGANTGKYLEGTELTLTPTPAEHYEFTGWTGDVKSTENPLTITVNSDMTVTANFAKKQYTLTVLTNDENRGTIDVATGSHEYGTEVTLTATPKAGYKLLAWSNKATTPSITLTMDNNKAVSAYFVKEYAIDPTFTIEKVWENTHVPASTNNGYQGVGWNGTIYVQDAGNQKILTYSDADDTGTEYVTSSGDGQQIAVDEAGNLIVFNATFYVANPNAIIIYPNGSTTGTPVSFTLDAPGRCDFITASGNIYGAGGGYVYFFCKDQKTISRLFIKNGAATAEDVTDETIANITNAAASQSNVVLDIYGNIHTQSKNAGAFEYNITTLTSTADPYLAKKNSTIGGCTFELGGKEFWAYVAGTTAYSSEWQLINATDGKFVSEEVLFAKDKTSKNSAANWLNVQVVDEKTAYIYQFCPTVAAAVWKVTRDHIVTATAENGTVEGAGTYKDNATAILTATANDGYVFKNWTKNGAVVSTENPYSFTVTEDVELVANFDGPFCELILNTNDEAKGTVSGAGFYTQGQTATIEATPKAGYKLLYWSDRSTENPRTITMTKNEALSAYFVKEYTEEPVFTIEKVWENTNVPATTADGYQAVGWDGKIYMQNKTKGKIMAYSNGIDAAVEYAASGAGQQIAVDEAGNLIVFNATFYTANPNAILIYPKGSTEGKAVSFTLKDPARCDFFSASGDIYSAEGGYVYFYCNGKQVINRVKITNGAATAADVTTDIVGGSIYATNQNQNHVVVDIFGNLVTHARSNMVNWINVLTNECAAFTLPSIKLGTLGGCSFELGGKELWAYHAGANNYSSEWNIYNMTDQKFLSDEDFYAVDKNATTNYACNWLNVQVVDENTAYIYQYCPLKAVAVWKVSIEAPKYTRTVINGDYGTICLPYGSNSYSGAEFYEIAYLELEADGTTPKGIWLDEVTTLEAGKPYIFRATSNLMTVNYEGEEALNPVEGQAGLTGTFTDITDESVLAGNYMIAHNKFWLCGTGCWLNANRAYIKHDALHASTTPVSPMPGRRRVYMGGAGENAATGTEDMIISNQQVQKVIENGQLIIIRDGVKYNVQGVRL